ncbi:MAG: glycosyltransferase [Saprospiraceae bacterium]|nr:glycosyltransferase [Saprospiraceae bacterium]
MDTILKVVIASHNRPHYILDTVNSVLNAVKSLPPNVSITVEISENSSNDDCLSILNGRFDDVQVTPRRPYMEAIDHFIQIISEADSQYLVIFHDDDLMSSNFLSSLYSIIASDKQIAAVGKCL